MNYCERSINGVKVVEKGQDRDYDTSLKKYLDALCNARLSTFDGTIEAVKKRFGYQRRVPLYVNSSMLLFSITSLRDLDGVWINYFQIDQVDIKKDGVQILFLDGTSLHVGAGKNYLQTQIRRCEEIVGYLTNKSIESVYNYGLSIEI